MARRCLAKAIYDNVAETPNELAFRKGDILTVIAQNVPGLDGWWHCAFRSKQGIAPGNRLQLLAGMYPAEDNESAGDLQGEALSSMLADYDVPRALGRQEQPANSPVRQPLEGLGSDKVPAQSLGDTMYDVLPAARGIVVGSAAVTPFKSLPGTLVAAKAKEGSGWPVSPASDGESQGKALPIRDATYDIPQSLALQQLRAGEDMSSRDPSPGAFAQRDVEYDIPASLARLRVGGNKSGSTVMKELSPPSLDRLYDVPQRLRADPRASGFSVASSSTSWSSSGCGGESVSSGTASARSSLELLDIYDVPPSGAARAVAADGWSRYSGDGSPATVTDELYDELPRGAARPIPGTQQAAAPDMKSRVSLMKASAAEAGGDVIYDVPPQVVRDSGMASDSGLQTSPGGPCASGPNQPSLHEEPQDELLLQLDSAIELLIKLQQDVTTSVSRLMGFAAKDSWRKRQNLEAVMYDVKMACIGVQTTLQEFVDFAHGASANLANHPPQGDRMLSTHLTNLLLPVEDKLHVINKSMKALGVLKWQLSKLAVDAPSGGGGKGDELDTVVMCAQDSLTEAVGRVVLLIKANGALIFRKPDNAGRTRGALMHKSGLVEPIGSNQTMRSYTAPLPCGTAAEHHEYDYIELDAGDDRSAAQMQGLSHSGLCLPTNDMGNKSLLNVDKPHTNGYTSITADDRQFLSYYRCPISNIVDSVNDANARLLSSIRQFESPQKLVALSKDVVMQAHRLVYIGETLGRSLAHVSTRTDISNAANELCNCLKNIIVSTKDILVGDPTQSNKALQIMISRTTDVQKSVMQFKAAVTRPIAT